MVMTAQRTADGAEEHIPLYAAVAIAYHRITGRSSTTRDRGELDRELNEVARAIAGVAPVHTFDPIRNGPRPLSEVELATTRFSHAATVLLGDQGLRYTALSIARKDLTRAIQALTS